MTPHYDQMRIFAVSLIMACLIVLMGFAFSGCVSVSKKKAVAAATAANQQAENADKFIQKVASEGMTPENQKEAVKQIQTYATGLRKCAADVQEVQREVEDEKSGAQVRYLKTLFTLIGVIVLNILYAIFRFRKTILSWAASAILKV